MNLFTLSGIIAVKYQDAITAIDKVSAKAGKFSENFGNKMESAGKSVKKIGDNVQKAGRFFAPLSAAVGGIGLAAAKTTMDFDKQMSTVQSISGATGADLDKLRAKAKEMGESTSFSATEAGQAMEYMALAGWSAEEMCDGIAGVMDAAAASGTDLATTSDIVTDALTAFGKEADEAGHFADVLVKTGNSSNTTVSMMGEAFKYAGAVAGSMGASIEDTSLSLGLMANAGVKASMAGTSLRAGLTNLIKPSKNMKAAMDEYGVSIQTNDDGTVNLLATMENLRSALGGLPKTEQEAAVAAIMGKAAMAGWSAVVSASEKDFNDLKDAIYDSSGAAKEAAEIRLDNLAGQITILKSKIEGILITIGEIMMPTLKSIVEKMQEWADKFANLDQGTQETIVKIGVFVAALAPVLLIGGKVISTIGTVMTVGGKLLGGISKLKNGIDILIKFVPKLFALLAANPIALVVIAITALVAGFVLLWNKCEGFRKFWKNLWKGIKSTFSSVVKWFDEKLTQITEFFQTAWETIKNVVQVGIMLIKEILSAALQILLIPWNFIWQNFGDKLKAAWEKIKGIVKNGIDALSKTITSVMNKIKKAWQNIWNAIKNALTPVLNKIKNTVTAVLNAVRTVITSVLTRVKTAFVNAFNAVKNTVATALNAVKGKVSSGLNAAKKVVSDKLNAIKDKFKNTFQSAKEIVSNAIKKIRDKFKFKWSLPKLKMPHPQISGRFSLNPPSTPNFSIKWYKKAMNEPYMFTKPTVFDMNPMAGTAKGAGEAGDEIMYGKSNLMGDIANVVQAENSAIVKVIEFWFDKLFNLLQQYFPQFANIQLVLDTGGIVGGTIDTIDEKLYEKNKQKKRGW